MKNNKTTQFKKGCIPWNKGVPMKKESKEKLSDVLSGKKKSKKFKENLSLILKGNKRALGYKHTKEAINKISEAQVGEKHNNWKGGITPFRIKLWQSKKYKEWRESVFKKVGCFIEAHHIQSFAKIIEKYNIITLEQALKCKELWNIDNGLTLCKECHNKTKKKEDKYVDMFNRIIKLKYEKTLLY